MKQAAFVFLLFLSGFSFSQEVDVKSTLEKFGLNELDHRGVIIHFGTENPEIMLRFEKLEDALFHFLGSSDKRDLTYYFITDETDRFSLEGIPLDITQIAIYYTKSQN